MTNTNRGLIGGVGLMWLMWLVFYLIGPLGESIETFVMSLSKGILNKKTNM